MARGRQRQFVKYDLYAVDPQWRRLAHSERQRAKDQFLTVVEEFSPQMSIQSYSLVGLRGDADFLLWKISPALEPLQELATQLNRTDLGPYLRLPYSYLAMTRHSPYVGAHRHQGQEDTGTTIRSLNRKYLFLYPFTKTHEWYQLSQEERQRMMEEHFQVGHRFPSVKINTTYSFGLDDQEFMLGFETDSPVDFLELVMALREAEARPYTLRDTPIFTCIRRPLKECLDSLD